MSNGLVVSTLNSKLPSKVPVLPFLVARVLEVEAGFVGVVAARQRRGVVHGHEVSAPVSGKRPSKVIAAGF